jgi:hypothetical protein
MVVRMIVCPSTNARMGGQLRRTSACSLSTLATRWPTVHASPGCNGSGLSSVVDRGLETTSGHDRASYSDDDLAPP